MSLKNPVTPPGIDPGTVRLVAQRLNHYATPGPKGWDRGGKCTVCYDQEYAIHSLLNFSETHSWEAQFLNRKWLALIKATL